MGRGSMVIWPIKGSLEHVKCKVETVTENESLKTRGEEGVTEQKTEQRQNKERRLSRNGRNGLKQEAQPVF